MTKTVIQAELRPELVTLAREFASRTGQPNFNGLLEDALQEFFDHHADEGLSLGARPEERQKVLHALAVQMESCAKPGWDGYGAEPVSPAAYRCACQLIEHLPPAYPMPGVGAEPDGHLTLEWYRSPSRVVSVSVSPAGELNYAALLGDTSRRTGSEVFNGAPPVDLLHLIREVFAE